MALAPYQRIISDVRARIADGRLAPGDRLPSTRQLAKDWGVALATATKAMTLLCQEGVLEARPRSGTFVATPAPAPAGPRPGTTPASAPAQPASGTFVATPAPAPAQPASGTFVAAPASSPARPPGVGRPASGPRSPDGDLTRQRIIRAAIEIADAEGLDALSMRGVAAKLRVATMSTYRHVAGKDDLVLLMADAAFGELGYPDPQPEGWRALMERAARTLWTTFRRHPWLAQVTPLTRPMVLPNLLAHSEQMHTALRPSGLDATSRLDVMVMFYSHVQGLAMQLEQETQAREVTGLTDEEWMDQRTPVLEAVVASGRYPGFAALMTELGEEGYDLDLDRLFELGLRTLLDGLAVTLAKRP
ncbi:TetR/AcrR family transcriptional regulator C-terminal domain-containing protein [Phytohabitans sp. LJ34]|uniref:TetR/AcrR family transcriptional regulator C-terminal domain-containing protein n=1 Tax=Phytohabitans sp. LJ34 TaxID=3452217 RepID=UPI003F8B03B7